LKGGIKGMENRIKGIVKYEEKVDDFSGWRKGQES